MIRKIWYKLRLCAWKIKNINKVKVYPKTKIYNSVFKGNNVVSSNCVVCDSVIDEYSYVSRGCNLIKVKVGKFTSIGPNVEIICGNHPIHMVSTSPFFYSINSPVGYIRLNESRFEEYSYSKEGFFVSIGNDVWIGSDVKILNGVTIGDGAIVAAGAVVNKDVEPYSIVGGIPSKLIKYRFEQNVSEKLLNIRWWNYPISKIEKLYDSFVDYNEFFSKIKELDDGNAE